MGEEQGIAVGQNQHNTNRNLKDRPHDTNLNKD